MSFSFSLQIISLYKEFVKHNEYVLSKQLLRSATSIVANIEEGNAAQTKKEFISKMSIGSKDARETRYWLRLLDKSKLVDIDYSQHLNSIEHIINVLLRLSKQHKNL